MVVVKIPPYTGDFQVGTHFYKATGLQELAVHEHDLPELLQRGFTVVEPEPVAEAPAAKEVVAPPPAPPAYTVTPPPPLVRITE